MNTRNYIHARVLVTSFMLGAAVVCAAEDGSIVPAADLASIRKAAPSAPPAKPLKHRKVLIFSNCGNFKHESIPWGEAALKILGEKSGAYETVISDDEESFDKDSLAEFDAVIMNNNCGTPFVEWRHRENLLEFVREGKGFVGIHCAAYMDWPEYIDMVGALAINHPWTADQVVRLKVEEPTHPVAKGFGSDSIVLNEEIYQFDPKFTRKNLRVLLSLDTFNTDMSNPKRPITRTDNDFFLAWVKTAGKGRVFYSALGHNRHIYWDPRVLAHFLAGIQYALGDLPAPAEPRR